MMRKYLLICGIIGSLLVGCGQTASIDENANEGTDSSTKNEVAVGEGEKSEFDYSLYDEFIQTITHGLKEGFSEEEKTSLDVTSRITYQDEYYEVPGYIFRDLDSDGVNELIIGINADKYYGDEGWDSIIYDIYTIQNGEMIHVLDGWERNRYYLCSDGSIKNECSGGAAYTNTSFYSYSDGKIDIIETVFTSDKGTGGNGEGAFYYEIGDTLQDYSHKISSDEATKIISKYEVEKLSFTPFVEREYDWRALYYKYLMLDNNYLDTSDYDYNQYALVYINDDDIPELVLHGRTHASGNIILTCDGNKVVEHRGSLNMDYIEKKNLLYDYDGHMGYFNNDVYKIENGEWKQIFDGDIEDSVSQETVGITTYFVDDKVVSETEYNNAFNNVFDESKAKRIDCNLEWTDLFKLLRLNLIGEADYNPSLLASASGLWSSGRPGPGRAC